MKELLWDKTLSVDVPKIDQDHRRLLELFNRLGYAVEDGEPQGLFLKGEPLSSR